MTNLKTKWQKMGKENQHKFLLVAASILLIFVQLEKIHIFTSQWSHLSTKFPLAQILGGYFQTILIIIFSILIIIYRNKIIAIITLLIASFDFLITIFNSGDEFLSVTFYLNASELLAAIIIILSLYNLSKIGKVKRR